MSDDDLRINTLHRFAKHSARLTLQEYSHCEVPAGCGGVVLRWVDPARGAAVRIQIATIGSADTYLDGELLSSGYATLPPGRHVLAFHVRQLGVTPAPVGITVAADLGPNRPSVNRLLEAHPRIERWAPGPRAGAAAPSFDDQAWEPPAHTTDAGAFAHIEEKYRRWFERNLNDGMTVLMLGRAGTPLDEAWIRITFAIDPGLLVEAEEP